MSLAGFMKAVGGRVTLMRGSVPCCRRAAALASSDAAARHQSSQQSQIKRRSPAVPAQPRHFAIRPAGQHSNGGQHASRTVLAFASGQAVSSPGASGTDSSQAGTQAEQYLTWWDRLTGTCVLAATALLALSFLLPLAASPAPAADAILQSLPAWVVRAAGFSVGDQHITGPKSGPLNMRMARSPCTWAVRYRISHSRWCGTDRKRCSPHLHSRHSSPSSPPDTRHRRRSFMPSGRLASWRLCGRCRHSSCDRHPELWLRSLIKPWHLLAVRICCGHLRLIVRSLQMFRQPQRAPCRGRSG